MKKPAAETRQHILDVAMSLMTQKGYTAVGLAELVASAGIPKGSFYYYFASKEEFGQALLEAYFGAYLDRMDALLHAPGPAAQRLLGYFRDWSDTQGSAHPEGKCLVVKLGSEVCDASEAMRLVLQRGTETIMGRIAQCIEAGRQDGSITNATPGLAESLYQLWLGASLLAKLGQRTAPFETAMATTVQLLE